MRTIMAAAVLAATTFTTTAMAAVQTEEVSYDGGGVTMKGLVAWDDSIKGKRPGVLVVHEWWGNNEYSRERAQQIAALGYVAMAIDMYGDGKTADHPDNAMAFMTEATKNADQAAARFQAAMTLLQKRKTVDPSRIAAIGYCFGGAVVLNMARRGTALRGVASFHGALGAWAPVQKGKVRAKVLVMTGADDGMIPPEAVQKFETEMKDAGADYRMIVYPGAKHGFTNPGADENAKKFGIPLGYDAAADAASWAELQTFLTQVFTVPKSEAPMRSGGY